MRQRLMTAARGGEGEMETLLGGLSHARFREACDIIARDVMPALSIDELWTLVIRLTRHDRRAHLGTMLKGLCARPECRDQSLFDCEDAMREWADGMTDVDAHKVLMALMPRAATPEGVSMLLDVFGHRDAALGHGHDIDYLLAAATPAAYFVLLGYMRVNEHNRPLLTHICRRAMQRGDGVSFSAASLFRVFFDLSDVHGTFSLHIEPYELGRLETDFALFQSRIR